MRDLSDAAPQDGAERAGVMANLEGKAATIAYLLDQGHRVFVHCMHGRGLHSPTL